MLFLSGQLEETGTDLEASHEACVWAQPSRVNLLPMLPFRCPCGASLDAGCREATLVDRLNGGARAGVSHRLRGSRRPTVDSRPSHSWRRRWRFTGEGEGNGATRAGSLSTKRYLFAENLYVTGSAS